MDGPLPTHRQGKREQADVHKRTALTTLLPPTREVAELAPPERGGGFCFFSVCSAIDQVAAGDAFSVAVTLDGKLWTWGANDKGQLGLGDLRDRSVPTQVKVRLHGHSREEG